MKICKYCQAEIPEDGIFCPKCGRNNAEEEGKEETVSVAEPAPAEETVSVAEPTPAEETVSAEEPASTEETAPAGEPAPAEETAPAEEPAPAEESVPAEEAPSAEIKEGIKATPGKIALAVAAVVVLLAVLIALIVAGLSGKDADTVPETTGQAQLETAATEVPATVPADGNPDDITCKGSYTVSDQEAIADKDTVVVTLEDNGLTNAQLRIFYRSTMGNYLNSERGYMMLMYGGIDLSKPLDTQISMEDSSLTWQQYFLQLALEDWQMAQILSVKSREAGMEVTQEDQEYLDNLAATLEEAAEYYETTVEDMLLSDFGPGVGFEDFRQYQELYLTGWPYYNAEVEKFVPSEAELDAYFTEHEAEFNDNGITKDGRFVDVRHILIGLEGGTTDENGTTTYSEEEWAACEEKAQAVLDDWLAGEKTEESFAALANEKSQDGGSNTNGGLYENVYEGQMVQEFNDWCFDESRQVGDYGLVKTQFGYHVMYFGGSRLQWQYYAESQWKNEQINAMLTDLAEAHPMEVDYGKITLGNLELG